MVAFKLGAGPLKILTIILNWAKKKFFFNLRQGGMSSLGSLEAKFFPLTISNDENQMPILGAQKYFLFISIFILFLTIVL